MDSQPQTEVELIALTIQQLDPQTMQLNDFIALAGYLNADGNEKPFDKVLFKIANDKLTKFSKVENAWTVCFQVLRESQQLGLSEFQIFQAASILKNKMMFDYAALKQAHALNPQVTIQLRTQLLEIVSFLSQAGSNTPPFILNTLAITLAYLTIHQHQSWLTIIEDITARLSGSLDQALVLLQVLKYMANDCDNESIVVEDSIRTQYYQFLDSVSQEKVFKAILDHWSSRISGEIPSIKLDQFKKQILDAFYCWIKLRLPREVFLSITTDCANVFPLIFSELSSSNEDNVEVAANCAVELLQLSNNDQDFESIKQVVVANFNSLLTSASTAISTQNTENAEQHSRVFAQLAMTHASQIIETGQTQILEILVKLLTDVPDLSCRTQIPFWKDFFKKLDKRGDDKQTKLQQFERILLLLLESLCKKSNMQSYLFQELNELPMRDE